MYCHLLKVEELYADTVYWVTHLQHTKHVIIASWLSNLGECLLGNILGEMNFAGKELCYSNSDLLQTETIINFSKSTHSKSTAVCFAILNFARKSAIIYY